MLSWTPNLQSFCPRFAGSLCLDAGRIRILVAGCASGMRQVNCQPVCSETAVSTDNTAPIASTSKAEKLLASPEPAESDTGSNAAHFEAPEASVLNLVSQEDTAATPVAETRWTLQSLQQLAIQNNPAIKQASAAASRADGIHNQTRLRPNPAVGLFAQEIGNEGGAGRLADSFHRRSYEVTNWNGTNGLSDTKCRYAAGLQRFSDKKY